MEEYEDDIIPDFEWELIQEEEEAAQVEAELPEKPASTPANQRVDVKKLLDDVHRQLNSAPATTPDEGLIRLEVRPQEAAYLYEVIKNKKRDELRVQRAKNKRFVSLDALRDDAEEAEEAGQKPQFTDPVSQDDPDYPFLKAEFRQALLELPLEQVVLIFALPRVDGNVSELARQLGQPQRKTARLIARIQKHFLEKGLGS